MNKTRLILEALFGGICIVGIGLAILDFEYWIKLSSMWVWPIVFLMVILVAIGLFSMWKNHEQK